MKEVSVQKEILVKTVAYLELIGGFFGFLMSLIVLFRSLHKLISAGSFVFSEIFFVVLIPLIFLFVFLFAMRVGVLLLRFDSAGFRWSVVLQVLQLPVLIFPKLSYNFYVGGQFAVGYVKSMSLTGFQLRYQLGSYSWLQFRTPDGIHGFFVNLLAVCCLFVLIYAWPRD